MEDYNNGVFDVIAGKDSLKTENLVSVPPVTFIYFGVALFFGIVASQVVLRAIFPK